MAEQEWRNASASAGAKLCVSLMKQNLPAQYEHLAICLPCGNKYGKANTGVMSCWVARCDWCGAETDVTSPSDFGYPKKPTPKQCGKR